MKNRLGFIEKTLDCHFESKEDMILALKAITDEDYNGNNGEDYFVDGKSRLENIVSALYGTVSVKEIINEVVTDNYRDSYYLDFQYVIVDSSDDYYHVVIAYLA